MNQHMRFERGQLDCMKLVPETLVNGGKQISLNNPNLTPLNALLESSEEVCLCVLSGTLLY